MRLALVIMLLVSASTVHAAGPVLAPPSTTMTGMHTRTRSLPATVLVAETVDHDGLRRVLDRGGFIAASEREFYGRTRAFTHVTERVLRFRGASGASRYVDWLRAETPSSLGEARAVTAFGSRPGSFVYRPRGCGCHTDTPTYLIAWSRAGVALTVLASGPGATRTTVAALARALERSIA